MREKNAVQRAVTALLDELAPERVLRRADQLAGAIEEHRTPSGCVLQAPTAAVSVSWFAKEEQDAPLGELRIIVWSGTVTRRGARRRTVPAEQTSELVLHPVETGDQVAWRATDGTEFDCPALAARCLSLLEDEIRRG